MPAPARRSFTPPPPPPTPPPVDKAPRRPPGRGRTVSRAVMDLQAMDRYVTTLKDALYRRAHVVPWFDPKRNHPPRTAEPLLPASRVEAGRERTPAGQGPA